MWDESECELCVRSGVGIEGDCRVITEWVREWGKVWKREKRSDPVPASEGGEWSHGSSPRSFDFKSLEWMNFQISLCLSSLQDLCLLNHKMDEEVFKKSMRGDSFSSLFYPLSTWDLSFGIVIDFILFTSLTLPAKIIYPSNIFARTNFST